MEQRLQNYNDMVIDPDAKQQVCRPPRFASRPISVPAHYVEQKASELRRHGNDPDAKLPVTLAAVLRVQANSLPGSKPASRMTGMGEFSPPTSLNSHE